jgi:alkanesulfonate monooxygenase SsuD/methylene tetrahydromethanopterin reductase-like flavin-dependent oxidoreductase (luciferase family)
VRGEPVPAGRFYGGELTLAPLPERPPEVWFGSWGSDRRLASMAATADGWFASAYNATPQQYADARARLDDHLRDAGRSPETFPDTVATAWLHVTEDRAEAEHVLTRVLAPILRRDPDTLRHLPVGGAAHCAEALAAYAEAGADQVLLWPLRDATDQLERAAAFLSR